MPHRQIKFGNVYANLDDSQPPEGIAAECIDGYVDEIENHVKRDGLTLLATASGSAAIDGIYETKSVSPGTVLVATNTSIYKMASNGSFTSLSGNYDNAGTQLIWAEDYDYVYATSGGKPHRIDLSANSVADVGGNSPTSCTHIVWLQNFLMTNGLDSGGAGNKGDIHFSDDIADKYGLTDSWEVFNNETHPDDCEALLGDWEEVFAVGSNSIEARYNDGSTPFGRLEGTYVSWGTPAPYSALLINGELYFLMERQGSVKVGRIRKRVPEPISWPYDSLVRGLSSHTDARAFSIVMKGRPFYVITWPTANVTLAYNIEQNNWTRWGHWNGSTHDRWLGNCYCYSRNHNKHYVGDRRGTGKIFTIGGTQDDSGTIRMELRSGFIGGQAGSRSSAAIHSDSMKFNNYIRTKTTGASFTLQYRNDGTGSFGNSRTVANPSGTFFTRTNRWGSYRQRQWEILHTNNEAFVLSEFSEDYREGVR